jgi:hypothetical protein
MKQVGIVAIVVGVVVLVLDLFEMSGGGLRGLVAAGSRHRLPS